MARRIDGSRDAVAVTPSRPERIAFSSTLALTLWIVCWEAAFAPLRPGSAWLALKALPLALFLPGLARGARRPRQWLALLLPWYLAEGIVRASTEHGRHAVAAGLAATLAAMAFASLLWTFHREGRVARRDDDA